MNKSNMIRLICFSWLLVSLFSCQRSQSLTSSALNQTKDSININGIFSWNNPEITGYPSKVKVSSLTSPEEIILTEVDSLGSFELSLPIGKYLVKPELNYHWMGEELVRIDEESSHMEFEVFKTKTNDLNIKLDTIPWPKNHIGPGILHTNNEVDLASIDQFMKERMEFFEIPGATLSVIKDGELLFNNVYGVTNINTGKSVTKETLFETGSITKIVFAFAVMRLYERGEIDLDKPLFEYLEHDEIDDDRYKLITARHVLSHQTGMSNWPRKDENGKFGLNFTPGTKYSYSGKAFEYLKEVLVAITSKDIESILRDEVMVPLEITNMHFKGDEAIEKFGANGHKKYIPSEIFLPKRTMVAFTLQTTSQELAKFMIALSQRKGLKSETYEEMLRIHSERSDGTKWGLGVRIEETTSGLSYGHSGSAGRGFIGNLVLYDENGTGFVILTNSQMGGWLSLPLLNEYLVLGGGS